MKLLRTKSNKKDSPTGRCAENLLEAIPPVVQRIRGEVRKPQNTGLSVIQLRTMVFVLKHQNASVSEVAEEVGLSLPAMSQQVDGMVNSGLVQRHPSKEDRRRTHLALTSAGEDTLQKAFQAAKANLEAMLVGCTEEELEVLNRATEILRRQFGVGIES